MESNTNGPSDKSSIDRLKLFDDFFISKLMPKLFEAYKNEIDCIKKISERFKNMIDYNVPHGKKLRGICAYESLINLLDLNEMDPIENKQKLPNYDAECLIDQAKAIGWCIEFLQASFLVADDIMDNSTYRRGKLCWYLNEEIGNIAINDSFFLLATVQTIICEFVSSHPMYVKFFELFSQSLTNTVIGQGLDLVTPPKLSQESLFDFSNYTQDVYDSIVKWKTAFYSFCLPVQSALYLAFIDDTVVHEKCKRILIEMGNYFQVQDDYLDCYGDPKITGKVGTDIEESKCSWLVIQALKHSNKEQRLKLEKYYGRSDPDSVSQIKELFNELNLKEKYEQFEQEKYEKIMLDISNLSFDNLKSNQVESIKNILRFYAKKIFKRNK